MTRTLWVLALSVLSACASPPPIDMPDWSELRTEVRDKVGCLYERALPSPLSVGWRIDPNGAGHDAVIVRLHNRGDSEVEIRCVVDARRPKFLSAWTDVCSPYKDTSSDRLVHGETRERPLDDQDRCVVPTAVRVEAKISRCPVSWVFDLQQPPASHAYKVDHCKHPRSRP
jgi:hypothetical protein